MTRLQYVTRGKTTNWSASLKIKTGSIPLFRAAKTHENDFTSRIYQISAWESSPHRRWQYSEGEYRGIQKIYGKISERQLPWNEICGTSRLKDVIRGKNSNWSLDANALLRIINLGSTPLFRTARIQENRIISKSCNAAGEASPIEFREKFRDIDSRVQEVCVIHLFMLRTIAFVRDPGLVIWRRRLRSTGGLKRCQNSEHSNKALQWDGLILFSPWLTIFARYKSVDIQQLSMFQCACSDLTPKFEERGIICNVEFAKCDVV